MRSIVLRRRIGYFATHNKKMVNTASLDAMSDVRFFPAIAVIRVMRLWLRVKILCASVSILTI
jgi:hypothetical protein